MLSVVPPTLWKIVDHRPNFQTLYKERSSAQDKFNLFLILFWNHDKNKTPLNIKDNLKLFN